MQTEEGCPFTAKPHGVVFKTKVKSTGGDDQYYDVLAIDENDDIDGVLVALNTPIGDCLM